MERIEARQLIVSLQLIIWAGRLIGIYLFNFCVTLNPMIKESCLLETLSAGEQTSLKAQLECARSNTKASCHQRIREIKLVDSI